MTDEQKLKNHIPNGVWLLSKTSDVFIEDEETGELIQVIDLREGDEEFKTLALRTE